MESLLKDNVKKCLNFMLNPYTDNNIAGFSMLFLRFFVGILLMTHGYPKLMRLFSGEEIMFTSVMGMTPMMSMALAMSAEFIGAILIILGFLTRFAAVPIIITMLVVVFYVDKGLPFVKSELAIMYLISYTYIFLNGAGKHSVDNLIHQKLFNK